MQQALIITFIIAVVLTIWGVWRVFEKAGESGWKALIPFYNLYILLRITGFSAWWLLGFMWSFITWTLYYFVGPQIMCPARDVSCSHSVSEYFAEMLQGSYFIFTANLWTQSLWTVAFGLVFWVLIYGVAFAVLVLMWRVLNVIAYRFGKSSYFTFGLLFLPFIFWPILGFGSAEYRASEK